MAGGGAAGWGEGSPGNAPLAAAEWAGGVFACLRYWLAPAVAGAVIDSGNDLAGRLGCFRGNRFAKAALDTAWWDLSARLQDRPLHELFDGCRTSVEVGPTFDRMESIDQLLAAIGQAVEAGYARIKLKFRPGWDVEMLRAVRWQFPTQTIHIDCEGGLSLQHTEMLCRLDDFCLSIIEQPLPPDDLVGHAMVQDMLRTPLGLDESITTPAQADMALDLHSCKWISLKPGRVGGLTAAVAIHDACHEQCTPCWVGAMPQSAVAARRALPWPPRPTALIRPTGFSPRTCWPPTWPTRSCPSRGRRRLPRAALDYAGHRHRAGCQAAGEVLFATGHPITQGAHSHDLRNCNH